MKQKIILIILYFLMLSNISSQEICEDNSDSLTDLNSISKCVIEPKVKKSDRISVKISTTRRKDYKKKPIRNKIDNSIGILKINKVDTKLTYNNEIIALLIKQKNNKTNVKNSITLEESTIIPTFPKCKRGKDIECFEIELIKHISENFIYPTSALSNKIEGKVWVRFIIDKFGNVKNIKGLESKNEVILINEAIRLISKLPNFKPGELDGEVTSIKYGFPINFKIN